MSPQMSEAFTLGLGPVHALRDMREEQKTKSPAPEKELASNQFAENETQADGTTSRPGI